MKFSQVAVLVLALGTTACEYTTATFQTYEARNPVVAGQGGARETIDGVEIWTTGDPPRRYQILGTIKLQGYEGYGYPDRVLAAKVKEVSGNAAIQLNQSRNFAGAAFVGRTMVSYNKTDAVYLAVLYLN